MPLLILPCPCAPCAFPLLSFTPLYPSLSPPLLLFHRLTLWLLYFSSSPSPYFCLSLIKLVISWLPLSLVESRLVLPSQEGGTLCVLVDQCNPPSRDKGQYLHNLSHLWRALAPWSEQYPGLLLPAWEPSITPLTICLSEEASLTPDWLEGMQKTWGAHLYDLVCCIRFVTLL